MLLPILHYHPRSSLLQSSPWIFSILNPLKCLSLYTLGFIILDRKQSVPLSLYIPRLVTISLFPLSFTFISKSWHHMVFFLLCSYGYIWPFTLGGEIKNFNELSKHPHSSKSSPTRIFTIVHYPLYQFAHLIYKGKAETEDLELLFTLVSSLGCIYIRRHQWLCFSFQVPLALWGPLGKVN